MAFALIAELPLGTYNAHIGDGDVDLVPSPARLHAALLCAAASGPRAVDADGLAPCPEDRNALEWIEQNPPDGMTLPSIRLTSGRSTAYRRQGLITKSQGVWEDQIRGRPRGLTVAVDGTYAWTWSVDPPAAVRGSLTELCSDVSHLGMAETPVRLRSGDVDRSHVLQTDADLFAGTSHDLDLDVPRPGRTTLLEEAYARAVVPPTARLDRYATSERSISTPVTTGGIGVARYSAPLPARPDLPWDSVLVAPLGNHIQGPDRVDFCVATHRALISLVGDGAPAVLTGAYEEGAARPANRVAIQVLDGGLDFDGSTDAPATLALLMPKGTDPEAFAVVGAAFQRLREVRRRSTVLAAVGRPQLVSAGEFWSAPPEDATRLWRTATAFVPDTRSPRRQSWTMADALAHSVGLVWRDELVGDAGKGSVYTRAVAQAAARRGVEACAVARVTDGDLTSYTHKVNKGHVVQPLRALLSLGDLGGDRAPVAIGQSRHLGAGLLVPHDVSAEDAAALSAAAHRSLTEPGA